jgi:leucyl aminopeptidase
MKLSLTTKPIFSQQLPAIVLFAFEKERLTGPAAFKSLLARVGKKEFNGAAKQLLLLHTGGRLAPQRILLVGLGKRADFTSDTLRRAAGNATKKLQAAGLDRIAFQVRELNHTGAIIEAVILAGYRFSQFKPNDDAPAEIKSLALHLPVKSDVTAAKRLSDQAQIAAGAANFARSIGDLPGNVVYPAVLADRARQVAKEHNLKCTVLNKRALEAGNFGGLLAVGAGSVREPHLVVLEYNGGAKDQQPVALVGKAITFDSGGISIKPSDKMDEMKFDKCGGCAVLGLMRGIAELKLPLNVIGVIAAAENMPSATSYRPGDIVTSYRGADKRGVTIEVLNTDAEGRIVLGDALAYARERRPAAIIDFATLTGACVVALGEYAAGLMGNDEELQEKIRAAAERTGERVWPLPLWQDYKDKIKSHVADIKNTGGRYGGAITAAAFLAKYVGDIPWAHLDIAGTAWTTEERPYYAKGATGFGVRLVLDLLSRWS